MVDLSVWSRAPVFSGALNLFIPIKDKINLILYEFFTPKQYLLKMFRFSEMHLLTTWIVMVSSVYLFLRIKHRIKKKNRK